MLNIKKPLHGSAHTRVFSPRIRSTPFENRHHLTRPGNVTFKRCCDLRVLTEDPSPAAGWREGSTGAGSLRRRASRRHPRSRAETHVPTTSWTAHERSSRDRRVLSPPMTTVVEPGGGLPAGADPEADPGPYGGGQPAVKAEGSGGVTDATTEPAASEAATDGKAGLEAGPNDERPIAFPEIPRTTLPLRLLDGGSWGSALLPAVTRPTLWALSPRRAKKTPSSAPPVCAFRFPSHLIRPGDVSRGRLVARPEVLASAAAVRSFVRRRFVSRRGGTRGAAVCARR